MSLAPADARQVAKAAAGWLALLESGSAIPLDHARLQLWRQSCPEHESAWQKAQGLRQRFAGLPKGLAMASLDRPTLDRRALLKRGLGAVALVPVTGLIGWQLPWQSWRADVRTVTGERRELNWPDGVRVQLNTASAVDMDPAARRMTLVEGEMAVSVPGDLPATVYTSLGQVSLCRAAVGLYQQAGRCEVSVFKGVVQVQAGQGVALALAAGHRVQLTPAGLGPVQAFDMAAPGWREGVLSAQNQPLGDFLRELSRYRPGVLRWASALEALRVTGSFRLDNTDRVLALLAATLPVQVSSRTRWWVTLAPREQGA